MAISKTEKEVLYQEKIREGKSIERVNSEIKRDIEYERGLSHNIKELRKELNKYKKEKAILTRRIDKLMHDKKKLMIVDMNKKEKRFNEGKASIRHCYRVINYLQEVGKANKDKIRKSCLINNESINIILTFLLKMEIIKRDGEIGEMPVYSLIKNGNNS